MVFCVEDFQRWMHRQCAGFFHLAFDKLLERDWALCTYISDLSLVLFCKMLIVSVDLKNFTSSGMTCKVKEHVILMTGHSCYCYQSYDLKWHMNYGIIAVVMGIILSIMGYFFEQCSIA